MASLFEETFNEPLPSRLRPDNLDEFVGQTHLVGKGKILRRLIESEEYKNGKLFPNEVELSEQLHISRNTLRQAINKLVFEGLLVRKKGFLCCDKWY